uniref:FAS1 domain-containing protein n=1 Tax=Nelumbo nucifera TaxID=4432 RepID=A0A822ZNY6_NELNU|nr:TPA_asm: hypothetical protein HUJ06_003309 [Nelumbo nucifera]
MVALLVPCSTQPLIMQQQPVPEIDIRSNSFCMIKDRESQITGATIFVSSNEVLRRQSPFRRRRRASLDIDSLDPHVLCHIVPRRLHISDLGSLMIGTKLPTLLSGKSNTVTNATQVNYTVNDCPITHPNFHINSSIVVHGKDAFFGYRVHRGDDHLELRSVSKHLLMYCARMPVSDH